MSGFPEEVQKEGPEESHDLAPRAKIFRRDQANVRKRWYFFFINNPISSQFRSLYNSYSLNCK